MEDCFLPSRTVSPTAGHFGQWAMSPRLHSSAQQLKNHRTPSRTLVWHCVRYRGRFVGQTNMSHRRASNSKPPGTIGPTCVGNREKACAQHCVRHLGMFVGTARHVTFADIACASNRFPTQALDDERLPIEATRRAHSADEENPTHQWTASAWTQSTQSESCVQRHSQDVRAPLRLLCATARHVRRSNMSQPQCAATQCEIPLFGDGRQPKHWVKATHPRSVTPRAVKGGGHQ